MWVFTVPVKNDKGVTIYKQVKVHDKTSYRHLMDILFQSPYEGITVYEREEEDGK